jgi:acetyl-CoA C-acetyltransferase
MKKSLKLFTPKSNGAFPVYVAGSGYVHVTRKKEVTLQSMGSEAIKLAMKDAGIDHTVPKAIYVGNMLSGMLSNQQHLGPLLANGAGLDLVESATAEACCGAGGAALRWGYLAIASGAYDTVVVAGVEHMTHVDTPLATKGLATASHWSSEGGVGETFVSLNGKIMAEYMKTYGVDHSIFASFAINAHDNALVSDHATLKTRVTEEAFESARVITPPIQLFDASPICDGSAAVILTSNRDIAKGTSGKVVRVVGSAASTDILPVAQRSNILRLRAVEHSTKSALSQAKMAHKDMDIFELHDAYGIMACMSLENAGFVPYGQGVHFAQDGHIRLTGTLPIATFGGLKARGHPVGATGVYQAAEMHRQLTHRAHKNQVPNAQVAMTQNIGGSGASVFTHILSVE